MEQRQHGMQQQQYQGPDRRQSQTQYQGEERRHDQPIVNPRMSTQERKEAQAERTRQQEEKHHDEH